MPKLSQEKYKNIRRLTMKQLKAESNAEYKDENREWFTLWEYSRMKGLNKNSLYRSVRTGCFKDEDLRIVSKTVERIYIHKDALSVGHPISLEKKRKTKEALKKLASVNTERILRRADIVTSVHKRRLDSISKNPKRELIEPSEIPQLPEKDEKDYLSTI